MRKTMRLPQAEKKKASKLAGFKLVAEAGFEPTTFGL
jgi:hypothetical protein